jgi:hypothetical protein
MNLNSKNLIFHSINNTLNRQLTEWWCNHDRIEWPEVTTVPRSRIFIHFPPAVARRCAIQWALGLTYLSADLITPVALWKAPTPVRSGRLFLAFYYYLFTFLWCSVSVVLGLCVLAWWIWNLVALCVSICVRWLELSRDVDDLHPSCEQSGTVLMYVVILTTSYVLCPVGLFVVLCVRRPNTTVIEQNT